MNDLKEKVLDYAFLSHPDSPEYFIISRNGVIRHWKEGLRTGLPVQRRKQILPELFHIDNADNLPWKWLDNYLPILEIGNNILFANKDELWCKLEDKYISYPNNKSISQNDFYQAIKNIKNYWENWLNSGTVLPPMTPRLDAAWKMSLIHCRCVFAGRHSKYGVEKYGEFRADGFPPTIISMCQTLANFNHLSEAQELFSYYLTRFVRSNGTLDYYGSSFAEYGMLLATGALLCSKDNGQEYFHKISQPLTAMCRFLYNVMNPWVTEPGSYYYLPCGSPEADRRKDKGEYFHNAAWMYRGMKELYNVAAPFMEKETAWELRHISDVLKSRIDKAWNERLTALNGFPPYAVHVEEPFDDVATNVERAYANYRYYPEMLSSEVFDQDSMLKIVRVREECKGEIAGMTRFYWPEYPEELADHWTLFSYARGLMALKDKSRFMKLLRAHLVNYMSPDLFYAYESVTINGSPRFGYSDWCVPAQLVLPQMLLATFSYTTFNGETVNWNGPDKEVLDSFR